MPLDISTLCKYRLDRAKEFYETIESYVTKRLTAEAKESQ